MLSSFITNIYSAAFSQEVAAQPVGHAVKGVPIAVAEEEGSESEEDELKPRGATP